MQIRLPNATQRQQMLAVPSCNRNVKEAGNNRQRLLQRGSLLALFDIGQS